MKTKEQYLEALATELKSNGGKATMKLAKMTREAFIHGVSMSDIEAMVKGGGWREKAMTKLKLGSIMED